MHLCRCVVSPEHYVNTSVDCIVVLLVPAYCHTNTHLSIVLGLPVAIHERIVIRAVSGFGSGSGWNPAIFQIWQKSGSGKNPTGAG